MTTDQISLQKRLENIESKCSSLLRKNNSYYSLDDYKHLWSNFESILLLLISQYPGVFDDVPIRKLRPVQLEENGPEFITEAAAEFLFEDVQDCLRYLNAAKGKSSFSKAFDEEKTIPEHVRRNIFDVFRLSNRSWYGRLEDTDFLKRIYKLEEIPTTDLRFNTAADDICQHRVNNNDWPEDWIFDDERFELLNGPDSILLNFLCQTVHPAVRDKQDEIDELVQHINEQLSKAGWQIIPQSSVAGRSIFTAVRSYREMLEKQFSTVHETLNTEYILTLLNRMHSSIENDPELAIGSAKELVEAVCKTILNDKKVEFEKNDNLQKLVKTAMKELSLNPDDLPENTKALNIIKPMLKSLSNVSQSLAELRGQFGTGHGKDANARGLGPRHARLAVGAAGALAVFMYDTYIERLKKPALLKESVKQVAVTEPERL